MIKRIAQSIRHRINNAEDYLRDKERLGLSMQDFVDLKNNKFGTKWENAIRFHGFNTHFNSSYWFLHSIREIFVDEVYKFLPSRKDALILDCGANIGLSVLYFRRICPDAKIVAFEPDPSIFKLTEKNIEEFGLANIELINKAVWIGETILEFDSEGALGGRLGVGSETKNKTEVPTVRLRDYLDQKVDFLKIDIEGAEYAVLADCFDKLGNVENLFVEYHVRSSEDQQLDEILRWIKEAGFRYYVSEAAENQKHPFVSRSGEVYEMQLNISCYHV